MSATQPSIVDIYCRTATNEPETPTNLQEQEDACRAYCASHGLSIGMVHHEIASGVVYRERKQLSLMRERYCNGTIQGVVVRGIDRLSRSQDHIAILMREMDAHHVTLHRVQEQLGDRLYELMRTMHET
jgi:DNA invertase Pin-like site-specific DNA recombinase